MLRSTLDVQQKAQADRKRRECHNANVLRLHGIKPGKNPSSKIGTRPQAGHPHDDNTPPAA